jgi:hypothetical protein
VVELRKEERDVGELGSGKTCAWTLTDSRGRDGMAFKLPSSDKDRIGEVFEDNMGPRTLISVPLRGAVRRRSCGHTAAAVKKGHRDVCSTASPPEWLTHCPGVVHSTRLSVSYFVMGNPSPQSDVDMLELSSAVQNDWPMCSNPGRLCIRQSSLRWRWWAGHLAVVLYSTASSC